MKNFNEIYEKVYTELKYYNVINFTLELTEKILKNIRKTEI